MYVFVVDFDGTVSPRDTVDALLQRFAHPSWMDIEEEWVAGRLNSQQCMKAQLSLVTAERGELDDFFRSVTVDPSFAEFVSYARGLGEIAVVSDGLDYPIHDALRRASIGPIPVFANRLEFQDSGLDIDFPHADMACVPRSGVCKCAVARSFNGDRGLPVILIGDGRSDYCLARSSDYVFAKGSLRKYCESEGIPHIRYETFADILAVIRAWDAAPLIQHQGIIHVA